MGLLVIGSHAKSGSGHEVRWAEMAYAENHSFGRLLGLLLSAAIGTLVACLGLEWGIRGSDATLKTLLLEKALPFYTFFSIGIVVSFYFCPCRRSNR